MISQTKNTAVSTLSAESGEFTIKNSSKMFHLLISGLYSNKIQSITREIWANALDAHAQAGCPERPFDVSFPSPLDMTFRVRDYGVSLSHDQIMNLYTTLGESTKEDSNDFVGKWGLGSKSPFAYTDNFTVTAILDGEKRLYSAIIGSDGVPMIHLMGSEETDEANGIEVSFPVEKEDIRAFADAARRVSHGFTVKPNVINNTSFGGWPHIDVMAEGDDWKLLRTGLDGYRGQAYARMGCVLYPIDSAALGSINAEQRSILDAPFVLDFAMGELEMTPSREGLQYGRNQPTSDSIIRKIDGLVGKLTDKVLEDYAGCETFFEACCKYTADLRVTMPPVMKEILISKAQWKGKKLTQSVQLENYRGMDIHVLRSKDLKRKAYRFGNDAYPSVEADPATVFMIEDHTGTAKVARAAQRIMDHYVRTGKKLTQIVWVRAYNARLLQTELISMMEVFDGVEFISVDDLQMPPKAASAPRKPVLARVLSSRGFVQTQTFVANEFDEGGVYVRLERMEPIIPRGMASPMRLFNLLVEAGALRASTDVFGAPKSMWKQFEEEQWEDLYAFAVRWLTAQDVNIEELRARRAALQAITGDQKLAFMKRYVNLEAVGANSPALAAVELLTSAANETVPLVSNLQSLAAAVSMTVSEGEEVTDPYMEQYNAACASITESYPLMNAIHATYGDITIDMVTDYVIMCDTARSANRIEQRLAA